MILLSSIIFWCPPVPTKAGGYGRVSIKVVELVLGKALSAIEATFGIFADCGTYSKTSPWYWTVLAHLRRWIKHSNLEKRVLDSGKPWWCRRMEGAKVGSRYILILFVLSFCYPALKLSIHQSLRSCSNASRVGEL